MRVIRFWTIDDPDRTVGTWTMQDGVVTASPEVADVLAAALNRMTPAEAWEFYASWSNGHAASQEVDAEP